MTDKYFANYLDKNPDVAKEVNMFSGRQASNQLKHHINDEKKYVNKLKSYKTKLQTKSEITRLENNKQMPEMVKWENQKKLHASQKQIHTLQRNMHALNPNATYDKDAGDVFGFDNHALNRKQIKGYLDLSKSYVPMNKYKAEHKSPYEALNNTIAKPQDPNAKKSFASYLDNHPEVSNVLLMDSGNKIIKKLKQDQAKNPDKSANETKEYNARIRGTNPNEIYKDNLDRIKELPDLTLNGSISKIVSPTALNRKDVEHRVNDIYQWNKKAPREPNGKKMVDVLNKGHVKDALKNTTVNPEPVSLEEQAFNKKDMIDSAKFRTQMRNIRNHRSSNKHFTKFSPKPSTDEKEYRNKSKLGRSQSNGLTKSQILAAKRNHGRQR